MKINYVSYLDPFQHSGGGEMVLSELIKHGISRGHDFKLKTCSPLQDNFYVNQDLTIIADIFNCPGKKPSFDKNLISSIINSGPYIHFDNAYVDVCDLDYLPCNGNSKNICPHKGFKSLKSHIKKKTFSKLCFARNDIVKRLYNESLSNYFVSPLHKKIISKILEIDDNKGFVLRPIIDTKKFKNLNNIRDIENLFVGILSEAKGFNNLKIEFTNKDITLIGKSIINKKLDFVNWIGEKEYDDVPKYMNRSKNFVYKPRWPEPQGRVVAEAALCGCNIQTNKNVGATSFDFDLSCSNNYQGAKDEFWNHVESL
jgi:glycosyltransferase involved in cell wall biosynthesis